MKLKEGARRAWRYVEAFGYTLDYDPIADISLRVQRLESQVADLNAMRSPAPACATASASGVNSGSFNVAKNRSISDS